MVLLELVYGKKGPNDVLVKVTAYGEVLSFAEWLFIGKCYLDSEASYYPVQEGYIGKAMLMNALTELSHGVSFEKVLKRYKLKRKGKSPKIVDKRKGEERGSPIQGIKNMTKAIETASTTTEELT